MKQKYWVILFLILLASTLIFTNPSEQNHKDKVAFEINQLLQSKEEETSLAKVGVFFGGLLIDKIIDNSVSRKNYVLFSVTTFSWNGKTNAIGYGVLGNVFISEKIKDKILSNSSGSERIVIAEGEKTGVLYTFKESGNNELQYKGTLITSSNSDKRTYSFENEFYVEDVNVAKKLENALDKVVTIYFKEYENFLDKERSSLLLVEKIVIHE